MDAVVLAPDGLGTETRPWPRATAPGEVVVAVERAALCRTDLYVAQGKIAGARGVILGHEAAGHIVEVADTKDQARLGERVALDPWIPCGQCGGCAVPPGSAHGRCYTPSRLGIERDGVFTGAVRVPATCAIPVPARVSPERAAYLEPVAAAMGVLRAGIEPTHRVLIAADNRIARLTARILERAGFPAPTFSSGNVPPCSFDVAIDAGLSSAALSAMVDAVVPGGRLVVKSRRVDPVDLVSSRLVEKDLTLVAPPYGSFEDAAGALGDPALQLDDLFGATYPLSAVSEAFEAATASEARKIFLAPA